MMMEEMNMKFDELTAQLGEMSSNLEQLREERNDLLRQRFDLKEQRRYFRAQKQTAEASGNEERIAYLTERLAKLQEELDSMESRIEALEESIDETNDTVDTLTESIGEIADEMAKAEAEPEKTENAENAETSGGFSTDRLEAAMERFNHLLQKGLKKVADTLENVDIENLSQTAKSAATKAAKTVSDAATGAAKEVGNAYNEAKENRGRPGGIGDYRVSGVSTLDGGCYNRISASGSCKVSSDLVCREMRTSGSFHACGSVDCNGEVRVSGSFRCEGDMDARDFSGSGITRIDGNLKSGLVNVPGSLHVGGNISAGEMRVSGSLRVGGDCEADSFTATGGIDVGGMINADAVNIRLSVTESKAGSIGGAQVTVTQTATAGLLSGILKPGSGSLTVDSVEGDTVDLAGVRAGIVRGTRVIIHNGCQIDHVEYSETCCVEDGAVVGDCTKV